MFAIVDGSYFLHRALHAPSYRNMRTKSGVYSGGVFGFLHTLATALHEVRATRAVCVWDGRHSARRCMIYPEYKRREPPTPSPDALDHRAEFVRAREKLLPFLPKLGVRSLLLREHEGDDVIFRACRSYERWRPTQPFVVLTEDKDLWQLVSDRCRVFRPHAQEWISLDNWADRAGVSGRDDFLLVKALTGDPSDNVPGVPGVGQVRARRLVKQARTKMLPSLHDAVRDVARDSPGVWAQNVAGHWSVVERNLELFDLRRERFFEAERLEIRQEVRRPCSLGPPQEVMPLLREFELNSLISGLGRFLGPFHQLS